MQKWANNWEWDRPAEREQRQEEEVMNEKRKIRDSERYRGGMDRQRERERETLEKGAQESFCQADWYFYVLPRTSGSKSLQASHVAHSSCSNFLRSWGKLQNTPPSLSLLRLGARIPHCFGRRGGGSPTKFEGQLDLAKNNHVLFTQPIEMRPWDPVSFLHHCSPFPSSSSHASSECQLLRKRCQQQCFVLAYGKLRQILCCFWILLFFVLCAWKEFLTQVNLQNELHSGWESFFWSCVYTGKHKDSVSGTSAIEHVKNNGVLANVRFKNSDMFFPTHISVWQIPAHPSMASFWTHDQRYQCTGIHSSTARGSRILIRTYN